MGSTTASLDCTQRLADQLQCLTEVAETLTLRLLELEDRLACHEQQIKPLLAAHGETDPDELEATELRLLESEQRLGRLESLLNAPATGLEGPRLQAVPSAPISGIPPLEAREPEQAASDGGHSNDDLLIDEEAIAEQAIAEQAIAEQAIADAAFAEESIAEEAVDDLIVDEQSIDEPMFDGGDEEASSLTPLRRPTALGSLQEDFDLELQQA